MLLIPRPNISVLDDLLKDFLPGCHDQLGIRDGLASVWIQLVFLFHVSSQFACHRLAPIKGLLIITFDTTHAQQGNLQLFLFVHTR